MAGMAVTLADLAAVYTDHWNPDGPQCPHCGHPATDESPSCSSFSLARSLLARRRHEKPDQIPDWIHDTITRIHAANLRRQRKATHR